MPSESEEIDLKKILLSHMGLPFAITTGPLTHLEEVLKTMQSNFTGSILIQDEKRLLGIFTERDLLTRVLGKVVDFKEPIHKFMTKMPVTIFEEATLQAAMHLMVEKNIRHIPVVDADLNAEKIISARDVLGFLSESFPEDSTQKPILHEKLANLKPNKPHAVGPTESLANVVEAMNKAHMGSILVTEGNQLLGIFTERDALLKLAQGPTTLQNKMVKDFMTLKPETIDAGQTLAEAINKMSLGGYRHLPITQGKNLFGIISIRDVLHYIWQ